MATWLKQSTAVEVKVGPFVDSTDGVTAETALTITQAEVLLAKNAGDWTQKTEATSLVHESNGWYRCLLDTTDTNTLGILLLQIAESGALPVWAEYHVLAANVYDALLGGGDILDVSVIQWLGTAAATPTVAGVPKVDVTHNAGTAITAAAGIQEAKIASIANGAITAASIATDAIDADALAADALTEIFNKVLTTALTEAYAADGAAPTLAQFMFMLWSALAEFAIAGTTITAKKLDGATTAMTFTLDSSTSPTSRTRAT